MTDKNLTGKKADTASKKQVAGAVKKADIQKLYEAFIKLCDFTEEIALCGNCPPLVRYVRESG